MEKREVFYVSSLWTPAAERKKRRDGEERKCKEVTISHKCPSYIFQVSYEDE